MGVLYRNGDDVHDLLIPFVRAHGGLHDSAEIERNYFDASLGNISAADFWQRVGVRDDLEDTYLEGYRAMRGAQSFLISARERFSTICSLTNDLSAWSLKLRRTWGFDSLIDRWYVSGDLGVRKPDRAIFQHLLEAERVSAGNVVFVDDRMPNIECARRLGMAAVLFGPHCDEAIPRVANFAQLLDFMRAYPSRG